MSEITLEAITGRSLGSPASRRARALDHIPAVVYGEGVGPLHVSVNRPELRHAVSGPAGTNAVLTLQIDGASHPVVIKELQRHPIKRNVSHIDFLVVDLDKPIQVDVQVKLNGEAGKVKRMEGAIELNQPFIRLSTTARNIPLEIPISISHLDIGEQVRAGAVELPAGTTLVTNPETTIVTATATRATIALQQAANAAAADAKKAAEAAAIA
jgi:large subunit ribosomal protein L25